MESLQPINLLTSSATDPSVFITNSSVLSGQFEQSLLQQGLVGQAILPASVSGKCIISRFYKPFHVSVLSVIIVPVLGAENGLQSVIAKMHFLKGNVQIYNIDAKASI